MVKFSVGIDGGGWAAVERAASTVTETTGMTGGLMGPASARTPAGALLPFGMSLTQSTMTTIACNIDKACRERRGGVSDKLAR